MVKVPSSCAPEVEYLRQHLVRITVGDTVSAGILLDDAKGFVLACHHEICDSNPADIYVTRWGVEESVRVAEVVADGPRQDISVLRVDFPRNNRSARAVLDPSPLGIKQGIWMLGYALADQHPEGYPVPATTHPGAALQTVRFESCQCLQRTGVSAVDLECVVAGEFNYDFVRHGMSGGPAVRTLGRRICAMVEGRGRMVDRLDGDGLEEILHDPLCYAIPMSAVRDFCVGSNKWPSLETYLQSNQKVALRKAEGAEQHREAVLAGTNKEQEVEPSPGRSARDARRRRMAAVVAGVAVVAAVCVIAWLMLKPAVAPIDVLRDYVASGWMGECQPGPPACSWNDAWQEKPHSPPACVRIEYRPESQPFGGMYLQHGVFGTLPGINLQGHRRITFWARAESRARIEFKAGGINAPGQPYKDSFEVSLGTVELGPDWRQYTIDLSGRDLSSVIGGFAWVAKPEGNPRPIVFFLDDVFYQ